MGFYPPNTYFPYGQIAWLERVLDFIRENRKVPGGSGLGPGGERPYRVFVGLRSPPANLSEWQCKRAEHRLARAKPKAVKVDARTADDYQGILLKKRWLFGWDVRYGTVNHYLSQFYIFVWAFAKMTPRIFAAVASTWCSPGMRTGALSSPWRTLTCACQLEAFAFLWSVCRGSEGSPLFCRSVCGAWWPGSRGRREVGGSPSFSFAPASNGRVWPSLLAQRHLSLRRASILPANLGGERWAL